MNTGPKPQEQRYRITFDFFLPSDSMTEIDRDRINETFVSIGLHVLQDWQVLAIAEVETVQAQNNPKKRYVQNGNKKELNNEHHK